MDNDILEYLKNMKKYNNKKIVTDKMDIKQTDESILTDQDGFNFNISEPNNFYNQTHLRLNNLTRQQRIETYKIGQRNKRNLTEVDIITPEYNRKYKYIKKICDEIENLIPGDEKIVYIPGIQKMPIVNFDKIYKLLNKLSDFIQQLSNNKYDIFHLVDENDDIDDLLTRIIDFNNYNLIDFALKHGYSVDCEDYKYIESEELLHIYLKNGMDPKKIFEKQIKFGNISENYFELLLNAGLDVNDNEIAVSIIERLKFCLENDYENNLLNIIIKPYIINGANLDKPLSLDNNIKMFFGFSKNKKVTLRDIFLNFNVNHSYLTTSNIQQKLKTELNSIGIVPLKHSLFKTVNQDNNELLLKAKQEYIKRYEKINFIDNSEDKNVVYDVKESYNKIKSKLDHQKLFFKNEMFPYISGNLYEEIFKNLSYFNDIETIEYDYSTHKFKEIGSCYDIDLNNYDKDYDCEEDNNHYYADYDYEY